MAHIHGRRFARARRTAARRHGQLPSTARSSTPASAHAPLWICTRLRARGRIALHRLPRSPRRTHPGRCLLLQVLKHPVVHRVSSKQPGEPSSAIFRHLPPSSAIFRRAPRMAARICSPALALRSPARCILRRLWRRHLRQMETTDAMSKMVRQYRSGLRAASLALTSAVWC